MSKWKIRLACALFLLGTGVAIIGSTLNLLQPVYVHAITPSASIQLALTYSRLAGATMTTSSIPTTSLKPTQISTPDGSDATYWRYWWEGTTAADGTASILSSTYLSGYPHLLYTTSSTISNPMSDNWDFVVRNTIRTGPNLTAFGPANTTRVLSPDVLGGDGQNRDTVNMEYNLIISATSLPIVSQPSLHVSGGGNTKEFVVVFYVFAPGNPDVDGDA